MSELDPALLHPRETERLAVLGDLDLFGVVADEELAPLLRMAAEITGTEVALVTLIGAHHQWHVGVLGTAREFLARADAVCSHTILGDDVLHVPDTTLDPRFRDNPHAGVGSGIRMYAGAPLVVRGLPVGSLCVVDAEARVLPHETLRSLRELSVIAVAMLELRQRALDLEEHNRGLAEANTELRDFARACAHDLRAPLAVVRGYAHLLAERSAEVPVSEVKEWASVMEERTQALGELIGGLLAQAQGEFSGSRVSLAAVVAEVRARLAHTVERSGAQIVVVEPMPEVWGDEIQLTRLLQNLVANAVKFSRPGLDPVVEVSAEVGDDGSWWLAVADNGIGIPASAREEIAQRGVRLAEAAGYAGHGIGLEACRRIAEAHGGHLAFADTPGGGTTVRVLVPAPSSSPSSSSSSVEESPAEATPGTAAAAEQGPSARGSVS